MVGAASNRKGERHAAKAKRRRWAMRRIKSMRGVEIHETSDGHKRVGIVYRADGKTRREILGDLGERDEALRGKVDAIRDRRMLPPSYKDYPSCVAAVRELRSRRTAAREARLHRQSYLTPREKANAEKQIESERASATRDARAPLIYEAAVSRFLAARAATYARPKALTKAFEVIGRWFDGKHLDEITKHDIRQFVRDRTDRAGPYSDWPRPVGLRPAQVDVARLSAMFGYLIEDEERKIENPCSRYRSRHARTKTEVYRPKRRPVIP